MPDPAAPVCQLGDKKSVIYFTQREGAAGAGTKTTSCGWPNGVVLRIHNIRNQLHRRRSLRPAPAAH